MGLRDMFSTLLGKNKRKKKDSLTTSDTSTTTPAPEVVAAVEPPPKLDDETPSLWDVAYDQLKVRDRALVEEYEEVLLAKQQSDDEAAALLRGRLDDRPLERRAQMRDMAEHSLQRMAESRQGKVLGKVAETMAVLASVKGVVDSAVKVSPEASTVWAGICFVIPFVENLAESTATMQEGFVYLTSRMEYYAAFESVLFRPAEVSSSLGALVKANKPDVVRLYGQIIEYIVQCVMQIQLSRTNQILRGMLNLDDWKKKLTAIQETEALVARNAEQMGTAQGQETITKIRDASSQSVELLQSFLEISHEHLLVARQDRETATKSQEILSQQLELSKQAEQRTLTRQEQECLEIFTNGQQDYVDWKNRVPKRLDGTCNWLLQHESYLEWQKRPSGPILISADPGCGKSVLARFLIDELLPSSAPQATICYFFFKDQAQDKLKQALSAVIHQLLKRYPSLMKLNTEGPSVTRSLTSLWSLLASIVRHPGAGQVICVLDALDECEHGNRRMLAEFVRGFFNVRDLSDTTFKMVLTSRPYEIIISSFGNLHQHFPTLRIPGENQLDAISDEINIVIKYRVQDLSKRLGLNDSLKAYLEQRLLMIPHRTYLWIHLVFDYLEDRSFKKTDKGIDEALRTLPSTVEDAYEAILQRAHDKDFAFKAFCFVLAADRPLELEEMNEAINTQRHTKSAKELDLESMEDFKSTIRRECGLMLLVYENKVYFLHQTVREFLQPAERTSESHLPNSVDENQGLWSQSIPRQTAHRILADCCLTYLNFAECRELEHQLMPHRSVKLYNSNELSTTRELIRPFGLRHRFFVYCLFNWSKHVVASDCPYLQLDSRCRSMFDLGLMARHAVRMNEKRRLQNDLGFFLELSDVGDRDGNAQRINMPYMASLGLTWLFKKIIKEETVTLDFDERYPNSPLWAAVYGDNCELVEFLLNMGADPHDHFREQCLTWCEEPSYLLAYYVEQYSQSPTSEKERIISKFVQKGAKLDSYPGKDAGAECRDRFCNVPLMRALFWGYVKPLARLIAMGADVKSMGWYGSILHLCWEESWLDFYFKGDGWRKDLRRMRGPSNEIWKLFIDYGADVNARNYMGRTPLFHARSDTIKLLVENGADIHKLDDWGLTPLHLSRTRREIQTYVSSGIQVDDMGGCGMTPLMYMCYTSQWFSRQTLFQLLELGADPAIVGPDGRTLLHCLALLDTNSLESFIRLLTKGLNINAQDVSGMTPLHCAAYGPQYKRYLEFILAETSANPKIRTFQGRTVLHMLTMNGQRVGHSGLDMLLSHEKDSLVAKDHRGRLPLHYSLNIATLKLFVQEGLDPTERDADGRTLLDTVSNYLTSLESPPSEAKSGNNVTEANQEGEKLMTVMIDDPYEHLRPIPKKYVESYQERLASYMKGYEEGDLTSFNEKYGNDVEDIRKYQDTES